METDHATIHRWLAKVPDVCSARNVTGDPNQLGLILANTLPITSKIVNNTREHVQVGGASLVQVQIQPQKAGHEAHAYHSFDRKLRHKTREDRYEYKGAGTSKPQSVSHKNKKKRRRTTKHTMNDVFRAPNVARERLTLRGNRNVGIFNKGKASSPLKLGHVPDSPFSERRFLTKRQPGSSSKSPSADKKRKACHKAPKKGNIRQQKRPEYIFSELAKELEIERDNTEQLISQARELGQPDDEPKINQGLFVERSSGLDTQREQSEVQSRRSFLIHPVKKTAGWSRSATPYTWSETNLAKSQSEHALEIELLKLLRVGLFPVGGDDPPRESHQNHTYYNLDDLKDILDSRKEYWASEPTQTHQILATLPVTGFRQDSITEVCKTFESLRRGDLIDSKGPQVNYLDTEDPSPDKVAPRHISSKPVSQLQDKKKASSTSQPERSEQVSFKIDVTQVAYESPPDDVFFSNLDAAFWAIVDPKTQNEMDSLVMMGIRQRSPTFDFEDIMTTAELNNTEISKRPSQGVLSHAQVGVETLYSLPYVAHDRFDPKHLIKHPENEQSNAILPQSPQKELSNRITMQRQPRLHPSITHYSNEDPIPPGFWRQNRLY